MGRHRLLLALATTVAVVGILVLVDTTSAMACTAADKWIGECVSGSVTPDQVVLEGRTGELAQGSELGPSDEWSVPPRGADVLEESAQPAPPPPANCSPANVALCAGVPSAEPEDDPAEPVVVTLRDIASFRPAIPVNDMEPGGWAVEGLPANFVAAASVEVVSGTLLGQPADVRFTPVGYRWIHSDGGLVESGTPGATWAALGQAEFTATATSHTYTASGEYTVELEAVLRAEYRFAGSPWRSIAGTLAISSGPQRVLVGEFDTVLTQGDCIADPAGPGC